MECKIRKWRTEDAGDLAAAMNNKKIQDNLRDGIPYPYTIKDAEEFIDTMMKANADETYAFAIVVEHEVDDAAEDKAEDKVIGSIGLFRSTNIHYRTAEMGYYIAEEYWGKGLGTSAVRQACRYVFDNTDIVRIFAEPFATNAGSCRILEKAGFQLEGIMRKNAVKNGEIIDMKMYALTK